MKGWRREYANTAGWLSCLHRGWRSLPNWELMAPTPLALVCFRACPRLDAADEAARNWRLDVLNEAIMHGVTGTGKALLSHTKLNDKLTLRLSIGNIRTTEKHVRQVWELLNDQLKLLQRQPSVLI